VRDKYVNTVSPPASTTVGVPQLARPGALFEVEAIAILPPKWWGLFAHPNREVKAQLPIRKQPMSPKQVLTSAQRKERLAQSKARAWEAKKLLQEQDRAWREKIKREG
jgi:hypothetical protein